MRALFGRRDSTTSQDDQYGSRGKASAIKISGGTSNTAASTSKGTTTTTTMISLNYDALLMALEVLAESFDLLSPIPRISRISKTSKEAIDISIRLQNMTITKYELEDVEDVDTIW